MKKIIFILLIHHSLFGWPWFTKHPEPLLIPRIITIMLDPAGDPGRKIGNTYERGLTLQCAQEIKRIVEQNSDSTRIIFARSPGQSHDQIEIASFANRLPCDLFISIHFFKTSGQVPEYYIFRTIYDSQQDVFEKKNNTLMLLPYNQAYKLSLSRSARYAKLFEQELDSNPFKTSITHPTKALPLNSLMGITQPAFCIEIGIPKLSDMPLICSELSSALQTILSTIGTP